MKEKFYSFDGTKINFIGEFHFVDNAFDEMEKRNEPSFYITSEKEWAEIAKNIQAELKIYG